MKRCPECRRDYYDETLLYCLDDGSILLEGPASANEQATAIMPADKKDSLPKPRLLDKKLSVALIVTLAVLIIAGVGFGIYRFTGSKKTSITFESAKFTRLTSSGKVAKAAISPDGKWVVYVNDDGEQQGLWLQQVAVPGSSTQIIPPAAVKYWGVVFSPDGNYVYYTLAEVGGLTGTIYQIPVIGGTARNLRTAFAGKVSFSPDGKQITYADYRGDEDSLWIANADGSGQRQIAARRGNEYLNNNAVITGASWSPDGKTIVTPVGTVNPASMSVAAVSVETGIFTFFTSQKFNYVGDVNWLADGKSLLFLAAGQPGSAQIWQISYPSGEAQKISNDLDNYSNISLTADSNVLAAVQGDGVSNIWTAPVNDTVHASQVTSSSNQNTMPSWTPDGKMVFAKASGGNVDLYIIDPRGGNPRQLTANSGSNTAPAVSPDGRFIVFTSDRTGTFSLWRIDIDGRDPKQLTSNFDVGPSFSPDGREVVYESSANLSTIWKVGIDGGQPVQLTEKQSNLPVLSPDGKRIVCIYQDDPDSGYKIAILSSRGGSPLKFFTLPNGFGVNPRWMPDGSSIVYGVTKGGVTNLWAQPINGSPPKQITNFSSDLINSFDFSRDGKQIAFSRGTGLSDVVLISGFRK